MCLWSFGTTCTGREEMEAVSWADFLPVEAMCRSLAEPKDEEKKCVPPLHAVKARHSVAGSTSSFFWSYHIFQGYSNRSPRAASHERTFGNPGSALRCHFILGSLQNVALCV